MSLPLDPLYKLSSFRVTSTGALVVAQEGAAGVVTSRVVYTATAAGSGFSVGHVLSSLQAYTAGPGGLVATGAPVWRNETTQQDIAAPAPSAIALLSGSGLTDSELRASPVPVTMGNPSGAGTAANQIVAIGYLADIADAVDPLAGYKTTAVAEATASLTYIQKLHHDPGRSWVIARLTVSGTDTELRFASTKNNPSYTVPAAWSNRTALVYGLPSDAI